jgi:hypothetical protein
MDLNFKPVNCRKTGTDVMLPYRRMLVAVAMILPLFIGGCEQIDNLTKKTADTADTNTTSGTSQTGASTNNEEAAQGLVMADAKVMGGFDFRHAAITVRMTGIKMANNSVTLTWTPHTWPMYNQYLEGVCCFIYKTDAGNWVGGYIDWLGAGITSYTWGLGNIPYIGNPHSGSTCGFFIMSADTQQRSNVIFTTWP